MRQLDDIRATYTAATDVSLALKLLRGEENSRDEVDCPDCAMRRSASAPMRSAKM